MKNQVCFFLLSMLLFSACGKKEDIATALEITADITAPTTWADRVSDPNLPDYLIKKAQFGVSAGLIIEPGVVVAFQSAARMRVNATGFVEAIGTAASPIRFTGESAAAGFWTGILITSADTRNAFENCTIEYGGGPGFYSGMPNTNLGTVNVSAVVARVKMTGCTSRHSAGLGLFIDLDTELSAFSANHFSTNGDAAVQVNPDMVGMLDQTTDYVSGNGLNGIKITGGDLQQLTEQTWKNLGTNIFYRVLGDISCLSGLLIDAGASFQFASNTMLKVKFPGGYLTANGTVADKIRFVGEVGTAGFWKGILFNSADTRNALTNCTVSHGGSQSLSGLLPNANIGVITQSGNVGRVVVTGCLVSDGGGCGISKSATSLLVESGNIFSNLVSNSICE